VRDEIQSRGEKKWGLEGVSQRGGIKHSFLQRNAETGVGVGRGWNEFVSENVRMQTMERKEHKVNRELKKKAV